MKPERPVPQQRGGRHVVPSLREQKTCAACHRPFSWRRKWARSWAEVRYCSVACKSRGPR